MKSLAADQSKSEEMEAIRGRGSYLCSPPTIDGLGVSPEGGTEGGRLGGEAEHGDGAV